LQRYNFRDFLNIVKEVKAIGIDQISFLAADITSSAFNHPENFEGGRNGEIALSMEESLDLEKIIIASLTGLAAEYKNGFIAESPEKLLRIVQYYKTLNGSGDFPMPTCNAPWVSAVMESNGDIMPCFFHKPYGNIHEKQFLDIINSETAVQFRKTLDMKTNDVCKKCVCSLKLGITKMN
jgi:MoaA/NifB/PqqE/SkfB family radical SAM enzyme